MQRSSRPVIVIGTVFVDVKCFPEQELNFKGRNLGRASFFHGGVGRNVAEGIALLGSSVRFCASVQAGGIGREVMDRLGQSGVDTSSVYETPEADGHGMWVAILHHDGDLACSISQMPGTTHMEAAWSRSRTGLLKDAGLVTFEIDLSVALAEQVLSDARRAGVPVVGLPGNFSCIRANPALLEGLHTFICNQYEAEELWGHPVSSIPAAYEAALAIAGRGISQVVVTLGALGSVGIVAQSEAFHVPALPIAVVDTTGAGDAFVAGVSHALAGGADLRRAMVVGSRVAAWTVSSAESVCRDLPERIRLSGLD